MKSVIVFLKNVWNAQRNAREYQTAMREASDLAMWLWKKHYAVTAPNFSLCDSAGGILTQIDNMVCGLEKPDELRAENAALRSQISQRDASGRFAKKNAS